MTTTDLPDAWTISPERPLPLDRPRLLGILNVTPDSFSDGGRWSDFGAAAAHALQLVEEGADVIDVGGESTRPGAEPVPPAEQVRRVVPVIEALRRRSAVPISVDTTRAEVAAAALDAGADAVNDVSAGTDDEALLPLVASRRAGVILMHRRLPPGRDRYSNHYEREPAYDDVTGEVRAYLEARATAAVAAGVDPGAIVLDPGLGFGKSVDQNFTLIRETPRLLEAGYPILSAASRKSFLGAVTGETEPARRDVASAAAAVAHWHAGARLFRVHDVAGHRAALAVAVAVHAATMTLRRP